MAEGRADLTAPDPIDNGPAMAGALRRAPDAKALLSEGLLDDGLPLMNCRHRRRPWNLPSPETRAPAAIFSIDGGGRIAVLWGVPGFQILRGRRYR